MPLNIVFMGTPDFAVPCLSRILEDGHRVAGVFTQPDKPVGRHQVLTPPPVKELALEQGLSVYQPAKLRDGTALEILRGLAPDLIVVVAYGRILPRDILDCPRLGCVNVHGSILPKYRGAAPIQWAVIDGEKETGVTTMMMDEGIDTGDMLEKEIVPIEDEETGDSLHDKLMAAGARLIVSTLKKIQDGTIERTPQTDEETCYARMLKKDMGDVDWSLDAHAIERLVRGLNSWPGTYTKWNGKTVKIWKAKAVDREYEGALGEAVYVDKETILVKTGKGCLSLLELQPEGKKRMAADAFLRGYQVDLHTVFQSQKERNV